MQDNTLMEPIILMVCHVSMQDNTLMVCHVSMQDNTLMEPSN
jgi:hypothetical protein